MSKNIQIRIISLLLIGSGIFFAIYSAKELAFYLPNQQFMTAAVIAAGIPIIAMCAPLIGGCLIIFTGINLLLLKSWSRKYALFALALFIFIGLILADESGDNNLFRSMAIGAIMVSGYFFWYLTRKSTKELFH